MKIFLKILLSVLLLSRIAGHAIAQSGSDARLGNMLVDAVEKYDGNDIKGAETILRRIIEEDKTNDAAWYYLAQISFARGEKELAEEYLREAVRLDGDNFWYRHRLAGLYAVNLAEPVPKVCILPLLNQ